MKKNVITLEVFNQIQAYQTQLLSSPSLAGKKLRSALLAKAESEHCSVLDVIYSSEVFVELLFDLKKNNITWSFDKNITDFEKGLLQETFSNDSLDNDDEKKPFFIVDGKTLKPLVFSPISPIYPSLKHMSFETLNWLNTFWSNGLIDGSLYDEGLSFLASEKMPSFTLYIAKKIVKSAVGAKQALVFKKLSQLDSNSLNERSIQDISQYSAELLKYVNFAFENYTSISELITVWQLIDSVLNDTFRPINPKDDVDNQLDACSLVDDIQNGLESGLMDLDLKSSDSEFKIYSFIFKNKLTIYKFYEKFQSVFKDLPQDNEIAGYLKGFFGPHIVKLDELIASALSEKHPEKIASLKNELKIQLNVMRYMATFYDQFKSCFNGNYQVGTLYIEVQKNSALTSLSKSLDCSEINNFIRAVAEWDINLLSISALKPYLEKSPIKEKIEGLLASIQTAMKQDIPKMFSSEMSDEQTEQVFLLNQAIATTVNFLQTEDKDFNQFHNELLSFSSKLFVSSSPKAYILVGMLLGLGAAAALAFTVLAVVFPPSILCSVGAITLMTSLACEIGVTASGAVVGGFLGLLTNCAANKSTFFQSDEYHRQMQFSNELEKLVDWAPSAHT